MAEPGALWGDLTTRILSAVVLVAVAALALFGGPPVWSLFVLAVLCVIFWELAALCEPGVKGARRMVLAGLPVLVPLTIAVLMRTLPMPPHGPGMMEPGAMMPAPMLSRLGLAVALAVALPLGLGAALLRAGRLIWAAYGLMVLVAGLYLVFAYAAFGVVAVLALVAIVAISDTLGYFAGRLIGGPKFWPRISPKKTWSGTVAGWIGAALFGWALFGGQGGGAMGALAAVVLAFAGQMGDIAESRLKRRVGVKDSSDLIPGHGGFLDRFDALVAAAALAGVLTLGYILWTT